ncbi:MAG TPA: hypothetical protein VGK09_10725 [Rhodocyclaceae bacterium]
MANANLPQEPAHSYSSPVIGERLIRAHDCQYRSLVEPCDLLLVDFDRHTIQYSSLYLVEEIQDGKVVWMGCRNFDVAISGVKVDETGEGDWKPFAGHAARHWRIAGEVKEVFKPASRITQTSQSHPVRSQKADVEVCYG